MYSRGARSPGETTSLAVALAGIRSPWPWQSPRPLLAGALALAIVPALAIALALKSAPYWKN
ncbi:MAG TPA: hypothetical protein VFK47_05525 [Ktedonobacteraceae bacterium]|nr:hypothetical protein [Ktedonobacteraceae bacterium]